MKHKYPHYTAYREANKSLMLVESGLAQSDSFDALRCRVGDAIRAAIAAGKDMDGDNDGPQDAVEYAKGNMYAYVQDMYPGKVVYSLSGSMFQCDYSVDKDDAVTLGDPTPVELSYTPKSMPSAEQQSARSRVMHTGVTSFKESGYDSKTGEFTMTIIKPGFNKSKQRYYPASTLKRDYKIFEGAKMFADHQTESESKQRPEGSVHNWVANVKQVWAESDGTVKGKGVVIDPPFKAKLDTLAGQDLLSDMGVSIRAIGEASKQQVEGSDTNYVESLLAARSVDFVTFAGAGGQVEAMESDQNSELDVDLVTEAALRTRRPDLVALIESSHKENSMKSLEQQLAESQTENTALKAKIQESEQKAAKLVAASELTKLLAESHLPEKAQERVRKQFAEAVETKGMAEFIASEADYIKSIAPAVSATTRKNMGTAANGTGEVAESDTHDKNVTRLVESYQAMGLTEKEAKIAAGA